MREEMTIKEMFSERLEKLMEEKTASTGLGQQKQAEEAGLSSFAKYIDASGNYPKSIPKGDTLVMLANYYGVSCDYLLGRAKVKSPKASVQFINAKYGLSESSLEVIKGLVVQQEEECYSSGQPARDFYGAVNALLSSPQMLRLFTHIAEAKECYDYASRHPYVPVERPYMPDSPDSDIIKSLQRKEVRLSAEQAAQYHSQQAAWLLQNIIATYCKSSDEKPKEQKTKKQKGGNDNG